MGRSGYSEDLDQWALIRWRGAVASAIRGKRGQAFLQEMATALDVMPEKVLISKELEEDGQVCALGAVGKKRGLDMSVIDPEEHEDVAKFFGIPHALACEIMWENNEYGSTPERRWQNIRDWVKKHTRPMARGDAANEANAEPAKNGEV